MVVLSARLCFRVAFGTHLVVFGTCLALPYIKLPYFENFLFFFIIGITVSVDGILT